MRLVLQRVASARVEVGGEVVGAIGRGILALVGVEKGDDDASVARAVEKLAELRIFEDAAGKMNLAAHESGRRAAGGLSVHAGGLARPWPPAVVR